MYFNNSYWDQCKLSFAFAEAGERLCIDWAHPQDKPMARPAGENIRILCFNSKIGDAHELVVYFDEPEDGPHIDEDDRVNGFLPCKGKDNLLYLVFKHGAISDPEQVTYEAISDGYMLKFLNLDEGNVAELLSVISEHFDISRGDMRRMLDAAEIRKELKLFPG